MSCFSVSGIVANMPRWYQYVKDIIFIAILLSRLNSEEVESKHRDLKYPSFSSDLAFKTGWNDVRYHPCRITSVKWQ